MKTLITIYLFLLISVLSITAQENASNKILMVLPQSGYTDKEYSISINIFEENNYEVEIASTDLKSALGIHSIVVIPDLLISKVNIDKYKAIVFPGGKGVENICSDSLIHKILKQAVKNDLVIGAISTAPSILAEAGILGNCNVTGTYSPLLEDCGATYTGSAVEVSGKIITAENTEATEEFAHSIIKALMQTD